MKGYDLRFVFSLTAGDHMALRAVAECDGVSRAAALRRLLRREARQRGLVGYVATVAAGTPEVASVAARGQG